MDYNWSGLILDSVDMVSFIGLNHAKTHPYVIAGDTGHSLTQGVLAERLIADEIQGIENLWSNLYDPKRLPTVSTLPSMLAHNVQNNEKHKRFW